MHFQEIKKGKKGSVFTFIKESFEDHKERMRENHRSWALCLAWAKGNQNVDFNSKTCKYNKYPKKSWQSRLISNFMLPVIRANVSRNMVVNPSWDMIPATPDDEDISISETSADILKYEWQRLGMPIKLLRVLFWQSTCCSAFFKIIWDSEAGEDIQVDKRDVDQQLIVQFMEQLGIYEEPEYLDLKTGELHIEPVPPFNMAFDPLAAVIEESNWSIETQIRSLDWIVENYGNKWKDKLSEEISSEVLLYPYIFDTENPHPKKGIITHEFHGKKCKKFPNGLYCFVANEEVIVSPRDLQYEHGELPYSHFLEIYHPGDFWGTCDAEQIRPNQARYNNTQSVIDDCVKKMGRLQWLVPLQSGVKEVTNAPGAKIQYRYPYKPEQSQPRPLPAYIERLMETTRRDIQDTSSHHNVSSGQNEPGVRSGRAVLALQDADDQVKAPGLIWLDHALRRTGILALKTINQFASEEKIIQVLGEFNELRTVEYTGEMLQGKNKGDYFNVRVQTYTRNSMSRLSRESLIMNLLEAGLLHPQRDRTMILNMLGTADTMTLFDEADADRARQNKEIKLMLQTNQTQPVIPNENHLEHLKVLKKFMASSKRDKLQPEQLQLIQKHIEDHMRMEVLEYMKRQLLMQGVLDAGRPGKSSRQNGREDRGTGIAEGNEGGTGTGTGSK